MQRIGLAVVLALSLLTRRWPNRAVTLITLTVVVGGVGTFRGAAQTPAEKGDASRGAELFAKLPCASCHDITRPWPGGDVCPNLGNIATEAARIVRLREYCGKAKDHTIHHF